MDSMDSSLLQFNSQDGEGSTAVAHIKAIRRPQVPELASTCSGSRSPDSQDSRYHQKNELTEINVSQLDTINQSTSWRGRRIDLKISTSANEALPDYSTPLVNNSSNYYPSAPLVNMVGNNYPSTRERQASGLAEGRANSNDGNAVSITPLYQIPYVHGGYAAAAPLFVNDPKFARILKRLLPGAFADLSSLLQICTDREFRAKHVAADAVERLEEPAGRPPMPDRMPSYSPTEHGLPASFNTRGIKLSDPVKIMKWSENNPVVSAFGIWHSDSGRRTLSYSQQVVSHDSCSVVDDDRYSSIPSTVLGNSSVVTASYSRGNPNARPKRRKQPLPDESESEEVPIYSKPALEWDVFLDPSLVRQVDAAMTVVDNLDLKLRKARIKRERRGEAKYDDDDAAAFDLMQAHTAAQVEVDRLVSQLMRRLVVAHGSLRQLMLEAMGYGVQYNFNTVVKGSRDAPRSPNRIQATTRIGGLELSRSMLHDVPLTDEEEEQRDFESLIQGPSDRKQSKSKLGSRGMFMENWLSIFAKTLSLLDERENVDDQDRSVCSGSVKRIEVNSRPADIGQSRGLSGFLDRLFLRRDTSEQGRDPIIAPSQCAFSPIDENNSQANESEQLSKSDMFLPATPTSSLGNFCGVSLCLGSADANASKTVFPMNPHASHKIAKDIERIQDAIGEPLRLVLDLKSRRVPPRVWSRLIDNLRSRGLLVDGIGSFDVDELRSIAKGCSYRLTPILFFHSVGDLQRSCHANEVKQGDTVYFNAGSLMWKRATIAEVAQNGCCGTSDMTVDEDDEDSPVSRKVSKTKYCFQPYAYPRSSLSDWEKERCKATIEDYKCHFNLKIGVYVQEFSVSADALDAIVNFVNKHSRVYDLGLAFGGVNGMACEQINGDGYWNQRYIGRTYDMKARPAKEMIPLRPEDHHLVQKTLQTGAWGQLAADVYDVSDDLRGAITVVQQAEGCQDTTF